MKVFVTRDGSGEELPRRMILIRFCSRIAFFWPLLLVSRFLAPGPGASLTLVLRPIDFPDNANVQEGPRTMSSCLSAALCDINEWERPRLKDNGFSVMGWTTYRFTLFKLGNQDIIYEELWANIEGESVNLVIEAEIGA